MHPPWWPLEVSLWYAVGSCGSSHLASAHLEPAAKSLQIGEEMVVPNQHIRAGTHGKIPLGPSLHGQCRPVLQVSGQRHSIASMVHESVSWMHSYEVLFPLPANQK